MEELSKNDELKKPGSDWKDEMDKILLIVNEEVRKIKEEHKRLGIPDVVCRNGVIHYILPNGEVTTERPDFFKDK